MMRFFVSILIISQTTGLQGCFHHLSISNNQVLKLTRYHVNPPPGTVKIKDNLYVDRTEGSNFNWLEYLYWLKQVFGEDSKEYLSALPDYTVWSKEELKEFYTYYYGEVYLKGVPTRDYPVVGLNQSQIENYSKWRSDRVFEFILIANKILDYRVDQDSSNFFTIEKYFAGNFMGIEPDKRVQYYPRYRLPSQEDLEYCLENGLVFDTIDKITRRNIKKLKKDKSRPYYWECTDDLWLENELSLPLKIKRFRVYNLTNGKDEWSNQTGQILIVENIDSTYQAVPSSRIGHRNVCEWVKIDAK